MEKPKMKVCYVITERGDKHFWNRIGVAFTNQDGSINVKLDALPVGGSLQIRDYEPKEEFDGSPRVNRPLSTARSVPEQSLE